MKTFANHVVLRVAHKTIACLLVFCVVNMPLWAISGYDPVTGSTGIATAGNVQGGLDTNVALNANKAIINWKDLNTGSTDSLGFNYSGGSYAVLNRVADQVQFNGTLNAVGGNILVVSANGVIIGSTANLNAAKFTASGLDITNDNFLANNYQFQPFEVDVEGDTLFKIGDVKNYADIKYRDAEYPGVSEQVTLLGKRVMNKGDIYVPNGTVILAAGDSILITGENSNIAVQIDTPTIGVPDDYDVNHGGMFGRGSIHAKDVTFAAAGDIWSSAVVDAYDEGSSASVLMDAGEDVTITDPVTAEAVAYGEGDDDATATIAINAGGNVEVKDLSYRGNDTTVAARASNGVTNTATVDINAGGNVLVKGENGGKAEVEAIAMNGETNNASANVIAGGNVEVKALCEQHASQAEIMALAKEGITNSADVDITAGGNVVVFSRDGGKAQIEAIAKYADTSNTANINITTENGYVLTNAIGGLYNDGFQPSEALIGATAESAGNKKEAATDSSNSANVTILANDVVEEPIPLEAKVAASEISSGNKDGDVMVIGVNGGKAEIQAIAKYADDNTAGVDIAAAGDVKVSAECLRQPSQAEITTVAKYANVSNTANVDIAAGGNVEVKGQDGGKARIEAIAKESAVNTAAITVDAGKHVVVLAMGDDYDDTQAGISATAEDASQSNTATVDITANNVLAAAANGGEARIKARAAYTYTYGPDTVELLQVDGEGPASDGTSNTAGVNIKTFKVANEVPTQEPGMEPAGMAQLSGLPGGMDELLADYVDGGHVAAIGYNGGNAQIEAVTYGGQSNSVNTSDVLICAEGVVATAALDCGEDTTVGKIQALSHFGYENNANVGIGAQQGIASLALGYGAQASIASKAMYGYTNTADMVACTGGPVGVLAINGGEAAIESGASYGMNNNASTGVCADSLIVVGAINNGDAIITAEAGTQEYDGPVRQKAIEGDYIPSTATAETIVVSNNSGVAVVAANDSIAYIASEATADISDAYTGVCAQDHVVVAAGVFGRDGIGDLKSQSNDGYGSGGEAYIYSEAGQPYYYRPSVAATDAKIAAEQIEVDPSTANAETAVISHTGSVIVADMTGYGVGSSAISSAARGAYTNTAYTGVAAGADLSPASLDIETPEERPNNAINYLEYLYRYGLGNELGDYSLGFGNVIVAAEGPYSDARIISEAYNGFENTADTVVCAPGEVDVVSDGYHSIATIKSRAYNGKINTAKTQVYTSYVYIDVDTLRFGNGIGAYGGDGWINIDNYTEEDGYGYGYPSDGGWDWIAGEDDPILFTGETEGSTLIIDSYANRQDCPDCPPCPDCPCENDQPVVTASVAPLPRLELPKLGGCPTEMDAAATELGINSDQLQMRIADAMATNPNLQPCDACRSLMTSAAALQDPDGSRMAALSQIFNTLAPADAPFTPEVSASIATAFADMADQDSQYAMAAEYVDAFAAYVAVLENDLKSPVGDPVALVMEKYGQDIADSDNPNIAAYIMAQMAGSSL